MTNTTDWTKVERDELDRLADDELRVVNSHGLVYQAAVKRLAELRVEQNRRDLKL